MLRYIKPALIIRSFRRQSPPPPPPSPPPPPLSPSLSLDDAESCDEELSLPPQENRLQLAVLELSLPPMLEYVPSLTLSRRAFRFCPRFIRRKQISDVPPTATMNAAIPLVIVGSSFAGPRGWYFHTASPLPLAFWSPWSARPFIDHSSEIWNFCRDET